MPDETQSASGGEEKGPLPRSREAVDWWLKKWGRQEVVDGREPLNREDVERLIEANGGTGEGLYLAGANLPGAPLGWVVLQGAHLGRANLQDAYLLEANLQSANLELAILEGAQLGGANLQGAYLLGAGLGGADLGGVNLEGANLLSADLQDADLRRAHLQNADLGGAELQGSDLRDADLRGALLAGASISPGTNLEGVKWDPKYISVLEQRGGYENASAVYRRLKEWYRGAGMLTIAGEFHFREREASRKAGWQRLGRQFRFELAAAWRRLKGKDTSASPER